MWRALTVTEGSSSNLSYFLIVVGRDTGEQILVHIFARERMMTLTPYRALRTTEYLHASLHIPLKKSTISSGILRLGIVSYTYRGPLSLCLGVGAGQTQGVRSVRTR